MSQKEKTIYNALPKLPHFNFAELNAPVSYGRRQLLVTDKDGLRTVKTLPPVDATGKVAGGAAAKDGRADGCGIPVRILLNQFPEWKTVDDKVLRFFGYYEEDVVDSQTETHRIRKVKLHYFLSDGTLSISETPAVDNHGLTEGTLVARFKEESVDATTLSVGSELRCRGITYHLVDCDAATREFYETMGMPQTEPLDYPYDTFEGKATRVKAPPDEQQRDMRRAVELAAAAKAGTHASLLTPAERAKARDYYEHDKEVLCFYAVWEKREYRVLYHYADGTISIMFDQAENDGRDPYAVFMKRSKVPRDASRRRMDTDTLNRPQGGPIEYLTDADLVTGTTVNVFTREFYLYDCDTYTREHQAAKGIDLAAFPKPPTERDEFTAERVRPQMTKKAREALANDGKKYGASMMVFQDHKGEKDAIKIMHYAQDVFRFAGALANPGPNDEGRRFLISYYLADDTVSIYEIVINNSGHQGGKIFARREVPEINDPSVLVEGNVVRLEGVDYIIGHMDERTKRYLEMGMPHMEEAYFRTIELVAKAQQSVLQRFSRTTDAFRHYASSATQGLTRENVKEVFADAHIRITPEELDRAMDFVDENKDGWVSLADFTENFLNQQFMSDFKPRDPEAVNLKPTETLGPKVASGPIQSAESIARKADAEAKADKALKTFLTMMEARRTLLIRTFRNAAYETYDGNLGMKDFQDVLNNRLHVEMSDEEKGALLYKFYYTPGMGDWMSRRIPMNEVQRLIRL